MEEEFDFTKLKYVLYARKSTDDVGRQPKSIGDQIAECKELAAREGLHIVGDPLTETKSAKRPNQRPVFTQMIKDLKKGIYDGILSWNPDRLARNMREGGEIIDMIDEGQIKDLKFVTHHFSKDANGKMLLGLAFVLSKQYSDNLSQNVKRGVTRRLSEGKSPTPKHGYIKDSERLYRPDGKNFELICNIWELRAEGTSYENLVKYLNDNNYARTTKRGRRIAITGQMLTDLFKDPFYYGILVQKDQKVDLRSLYNFQPAITEELYNKVQQLSYRKIYSSKKPTAAFYPLKKMIICSFCGSNMYVGASTGRYQRYLNARCGNASCRRKDKSIRMKIVFDFIYKLFAKGLNFTEKEYDKYYDSLSMLTDKKRQELTIELHSKQAILKKVDADLNERALGIVKLKKGSETWNINERKINKLSNQKIGLQTQIDKLKEKNSNPEAEQLNLEDFLNLSKNASVIVQSANAVVKDLICRKIFLNLTVDNEKVLSYQAKEPFATLLKQRGLLSCADERT
ncbi:recombinase family protein [Patescibacteria group bacterium]|nr:recombinase family protein [Patescibacteria group bacterium]